MAPHVLSLGAAWRRFISLNASDRCTCGGKGIHWEGEQNSIDVTAIRCSLEDPRIESLWRRRLSPLLTGLKAFLTDCAILTVSFPWSKVAEACC